MIVHHKLSIIRDGFFFYLETWHLYLNLRRYVAELKLYRRDVWAIFSHFFIIFFLFNRTSFSLIYKIYHELQLLYVSNYRF